ncbi:MAG: hypothetical protein IJ869_05275 [Clostridiales bacterium]|nr:hypothetical protein [Clostridiales bacterium]
MNKIMRFLRAGLVIFAGIVILIMGARQGKSMSKDPIDLSDPDVDWSELEVGDHVKMKIEYTLGEFSNTTDDGKEVSRKYSYPRIENDMIVDVIGIHVNSADFAKYDALYDATVDWWEGTTNSVEADPIEIDGVIKKLDNDEIGFHEEYLDGLFSSSELEDSKYELAVYPNMDNNILVVVIGAVITLAGLGYAAYVFIKK